MSFPRIVEAALELQAAIEEIGLGFCFIGGLAIQRWSEPRFTQDADASVLTRMLMRHGRKLNVRQIFEELRPVVELEEDAAILPRLEALMRKREVID